MFKTNEGNMDRILRVVIGAALLIAYFTMDGASKWLLIGIVPLLTGALGWCALYQILGFSTCPMKKS